MLSLTKWLNYVSTKPDQDQFVDAVKTANENKQGVAGKMLKLINKLYKIERNIKNSDLEKRREVREKQALPILNTIQKLLESVKVPPKNNTGEALTYLRNQWPYLIAYINYPEMPISNILVENHIRPLALGIPFGAQAKNWLFAGNVDAANRSGLLYSLIQTCKINHINSRDYLNYVLSQAPAMRRGEVEPRALLPQFINKSLL